MKLIRAIRCIKYGWCGHLGSWLRSSSSRPWYSPSIFPWRRRVQIRLGMHTKTVTLERADVLTWFTADSACHPDSINHDRSNPLITSRTTRSAAILCRYRRRFIHRELERQYGRHVHHRAVDPQRKCSGIRCLRQRYSCSCRVHQLENMAEWHNGHPRILSTRVQHHW